MEGLHMIFQKLSGPVEGMLASPGGFPAQAERGLLRQSGVGPCLY
jgi:hypothetical protein